MQRLELAGQDLALLWRYLGGHGLLVHVHRHRVGTMEFELLGVVTARAGGVPVDVGSPQRRAVLAALLVDAGSPVGVGTLVDRVWGESVPAHPLAGLYAHISGLRQVVESASGAVGDDPPVRLVKTSGGYVLDLDPNCVDLWRFQSMVERALDPGPAAEEERLRLLRGAMSLWRGSPLGGLPISCTWAERERDGVRRLHIDAAVLWAQLELRLHPPETVIDTLHRLVEEYSLVEPLAASLITALALAGRVPEALERYAVVQRQLRDELGIDPGTALQQLHQSLLRNDVAEAPGRGRAGSTAPAQLPLGVRDFVGRTAELAQLDVVLSAAVGAAHTMVTVLSGAAGVGKTALALHWAQRARESFPDGQLYVDLRGFGPSGRPLRAEAALRTLLTGLGVAAEEIPRDLTAQAGMYRSLLVDHRVLVMLDNAFDSEQVSYLLPGSPTCAVMITSRSQLGGLALRGARLLTVGLLHETETRAMIAGRVGAERAELERDAVDTLLRVSAGLPLALGIVCARAAAQPDIALAALADEFGVESHRLDALDAGELGTNLRTVLSWSYQALERRTAQAFRLLGSMTSPDIDLSAAVSLLGVGRSRARGVLRQLVAANLVQQHRSDRYQLHDLVRLYAIERGRSDEPADSRDAARRRLVDFYLHTAHSAAMRLRPHQDPTDLPPAHPEFTPVDITDHRQALTWFTAERAALLGVIDATHDWGLHRHCWHLTEACGDFLDRQGHWDDWIHALRTALASAQAVDDPVGQAQAHRDLGLASTRLNRLHDAMNHFHQAVALLRAVDDRAGLGRAYIHLSWLHADEQRYEEGLDYATKALELFTDAGHPVGRATALDTMVHHQTTLGDYQPALEHAQQALTQFRELGDHHGEASALDNMGYALLHLRQYRQAVTCFEEALDLCRDVADRYGNAIILDHLGDAHLGLGDGGLARRAWQQAVIIFQELGHTDSHAVQQKLDRLPAADTS